MAFTLRQLELFRLLMQTRNVTETARLLRISQPAVSLALKELEGQLGLALFARTRGRVRPTGEAAILLQDVERLFQDMGQITSRAAELRDAQAGSLAVCAIPAVAGSILADAIATFRRERPRVRIGLEGLEKAEVIRRVREERADLGLIYAPATDPQVVTEPLLANAMMCLLPAAHRLAGQTVINLRHIFDETVIMHPSTAPSLLTQSQARFEATLEANFSFGAVALVRRGVGLYVTEPLVLLSGMADGLVARPFEPEIRQELVMVYARRRPVSRVLIRFAATLRLVAAEACARLRHQGLTAELT